jgi:hypothetical protein
MHLNDERAALGRNAVVRFAKDRLETPSVEPISDENLLDLLVCLRHSAARSGIDFGTINEEAAECYALSLIAPGGAVSLLPAGELK